MAEYLLSTGPPVTHITTFQLSDGAPAHDFILLWQQIANRLAAQSGFVAARLYRPNVIDAPAQYIHIAHWTSAALLAEAQSDPEIRRLQRRVHELVEDRRYVLCHDVTEADVPPVYQDNQHASV